MQLHTAGGAQKAKHKTRLTLMSNCTVSETIVSLVYRNL